MIADFTAKDLKNFFTKPRGDSSPQKVQNPQQVQFNDIFTPIETSQQTKKQETQKFKTTSQQFKHLQKSAIDLGQHMHTAMTWVQEQSSIELNQCLSIRDYNHINGMGYGLQVIDKDLQNKTTIMKVPITSCLIPQKLNYQFIKSVSSSSVSQKKEDYKYIQIITKSIKETAEQCCQGLKNHPEYESSKAKLESLIFLAVQVLTFERNQSSSTQMIRYSLKQSDNKDSIMNSFSLFNNYQNSWPKQDLTNIVYWSPNTVLKIRSNYLIQFRAQLLMQSDQIYKAFCKSVKEEIGDNMNVQEIFPPDQFKWAMSIVRSRHIPQCQFDNNSNGDKNTYSPLIIAPLIDYINHPPLGQKPNVRIELSKQDDRQFISLVTTDKIKRGQQLYMNYGDACSSQFLNKYGFTNQYNGERFNPKTKILAKFNFNNEFQSILREQIELKQKVLMNYAKFGIKQQGGFAFCLNSQYQDELKYLRLMLMSAQDLYIQKISNEDVLQGRIDFSRKLTPQQLRNHCKIQLRDENQYRVIKIFQQALMQFLRPYSKQSKIQKEDWRKVQQTEAACLNYIINFEEQQKRILKDAKSFMKNVLIK